MPEDQDNPCRPNVSTGQVTAETACHQLEALADEMFRRGFFAKVTTDREPPYVTITNKNVSQMAENVYAAPTRDGAWWFWWSWAEKMTRLALRIHAAM